MSLSDKRIQIDKSMFLDVYRLILALEDYELDNNTTEIKKRLEGAFNAKLDAMQKRDVYTQSKVGLTEEEREKARQEYLELAGIHKSFRYSKDFGKDTPP